MMQLKDILKDVHTLQVTGATSVMVTGMCIDSRKVVEGNMFIAVRGTLTDGHSYIAKATELGATVIVAEELPAEQKEGVVYVQVKDSAAIAGIMAAAYYGNVSEQMTIVGVTGTNGKTTVATYLLQGYVLLSGQVLYA